MPQSYRAGPAGSDWRDWPDEAGWQSLRDADRLEELEPVREVQVTDQPLQLSFVLPMPSVDLVELEPIG